MSETKQTSQTCCGPVPGENTEGDGGGCCVPGARGGFRFWYLGVLVVAIGVAVAALVS